MNKARFTLEELGSKWLQLWGIDIEKYFGDRDARNAASYWPNTINSWKPRTTADDYQAISDIWLPLEPTPDARFAELDKHLLRIILSQGYFGVSGQRQSSRSGRTGFGNEVESILSNMGMNESAKSVWRGFLTDFAAFEEPAVIRMANGKGRLGDASHVVEVMSRATMLLRLATGASAALLSDAGIERENLEFWIQSVGTDRGIWQPEDPPEDLLDLWADAEDVLGQIDGWMDGAEPSAQEIWATKSREVVILGECERIALWGLGL